jgi:hypothetical protein
MDGLKKESHMGAKELGHNLQGPKQVWVPKKNWSSFIDQLQSQRKVLGS